MIAVRTLGPIDAKNVVRDPLMRWLIAMPLAVALALRWGTPALNRYLIAEFQFDLSAYDRKLHDNPKLSRARFMRLSVSMELEQATDMGWQTLAECFRPEELFMRQEFVDKYFMPRYRSLEQGKEDGTAAAESDVAA